MKKVGMPQKGQACGDAFFWTGAAVGVEGRKGDLFGGRLPICPGVSRPSTAGSQRPRSSAGWGDRLDAAPARLGPDLMVAKPDNPTRRQSTKGPSSRTERASTGGRPASHRAMML